MFVVPGAVDGTVRFGDIYRADLNGCVFTIVNFGDEVLGLGDVEL